MADRRPAVTSFYDKETNSIPQGSCFVLASAIVERLLC